MAGPRYISEGIYWGSNPPAQVAGQESPLSLDASGNLNVNVQVGGGGGSGGSGIGADTQVLSSSAQGTIIGAIPTGYKGINISIPPGGSISFYVAASQAASSAAAVLVSRTYANPSTASSMLDLELNLTSNNNIWVTNIVNGTATTFISGTPVYRWI